jgi:phosphate transport system ATP-binding protein
VRQGREFVTRFQLFTFHFSLFTDFMALPTREALKNHVTVRTDPVAEDDSVITVKNLNLWYGDFHALYDNSITIPKNKVTALIGASGCGKSTLLRCINRMNDLVDTSRIEGELMFEGVNLYDKAVDPVEVRRRIGMVFQKPNPFPKSIFDNVAFGPRSLGRSKR